MNRNLILSEVDKATTLMAKVLDNTPSSSPGRVTLMEAYGILMGLEIGLQEYLTHGA